MLLLGLTSAAVLPVWLRPAAPVYLPAADQRQLDAWAVALQNQMAAHAAQPRYAARPGETGLRGASEAAAAPRVALAPFDPNALTAAGWEARGVPHFVAARIVKYGEKAGGFRTKTQVQRIYGLSDSVYRRLAPFMQLPEALPDERGASDLTRRATASLGAAGAGAVGFPRKPLRLRPFDLNQADTAQLMLIRGIGRGRAKWIVQRREQLGGFLDRAQLAEIFVLRDAPDLQDSLGKYTFVAAGFAPKQLNVNTATFDELWPHPYVGKNLARLIVAYRNQHGPYKTPDALRQIRILKEEQFVKLRPYVRCE